MIPFSIRLYRALLYAYPAPFRQEYAGQMTHMFRARCADEVSALGPSGLFLLWLEVLLDTAVTAPREHYFMLIQDVRYAFRSLRKSLGFTTAAVTCLALGIGASTAIFSIVNAVLLKPPPYRDSKNYARVYTEFPKQDLGRFAFSPPEFRNMQRYNRSWDQIEAWVTDGASLQGGERPLRINVCFLSGGMMPMLGVAPEIGRPIVPGNDDPGVQRTLVLSHALWQSAFAGDPNIVGRQTLLDGGKVLIVGVMPASFEFPPGTTEPVDAWSPLQLTAQQMKQTGGHFLALVAHLRPGVTSAGTAADLRSIEGDLGRANSPNYHAINPKTHPLSLYGFQDEIIRNVRSAMLMLLGAVAFFLLIACVNVANLLLARSDSRRREIAVRKAIGAGSSQLLRQFAVEGLMLSGTGAVLGVALAWAGVRFIVSTNPGTIPRIREAGLDLNVLLFAVAVAFLTGLVFCLAPMLQSLRHPVNDALKAAGGRAAGSAASNRFRAALVVSEISLALVLLIGSGLLVRAFWNLQAVDAGIRPDHLLTARISLTSETFNDRDHLRQFWIAANDKLRSLPGVTSATLVAGLPPQRGENDNTTFIEGYAQDSTGIGQIVAFYQTVGDNFFETVGARLVEGRFFDQRDGFGAPDVMIVNQTMAKTFWPGRSAIGRRVRAGGHMDYSTVIGVVADIRNGGMAKPAGTELFLPARQLRNAAQGAYAIVRTTGNPELAANAVRGAIAAVDPTVPVSQVRTMEDALSASESQPRFLALMLTAFSSLALALAGFGIYGVISYSVARRTPEFGIRMALGAGRGNIMSQVLGEGALLAILGVVVGCAGAVMLTRILQGLLYNVSRFDMVTFLSMAGTLVAVALFASWLPARRATTVNPVQALRYE
jgi:putative ABC transport system permease protein